MSAPALKPCPFCGGSDVKTFGPYGWYRQFGISHSCRSFYSGTSEMMQGFGSEADAIIAWNTRTPTVDAGGKMVLVPAGDPVPLDECPPGPFLFNDSLGFRSEYSTTLEEPRRYQVDAYCFESGEYFWGGASGSEARGALIVQPLALAAVLRKARGEVS